MKNLTPELIAKAKAAKSAEELLELAKANNVEITEQEAKICFEQLHTNGAVSDDELEAVAGGGICEFFGDLFRSGNRFDGISCPFHDDKTKNTTMPDKQTFDGGVMPLPCDSIPYDPKSKKKTEFI
jgi:hypothetical protein